MSQILNICVYLKSGVILYRVVSHKWPYPRKEELKVIWGKRQCLAVSHLCPNLSVTTQCGNLSGIPNSWTFLPSLSSFFSSHLWRLKYIHLLDLWVLCIFLWSTKDRVIDSLTIKCTAPPYTNFWLKEKTLFHTLDEEESLPNWAVLS